MRRILGPGFYTRGYGEPDLVIFQLTIPRPGESWSHGLMNEDRVTKPEPQALEREKGKLWVTDAELIRRMGVPEKTARETPENAGCQEQRLPRKQKLWRDRRYWPAVVAYFDYHYGFDAKRKP